MSINVDQENNESISFDDDEEGNWYIADDENYTYETSSNIKISVNSQPSSSYSIYPNPEEEEKIKEVSKKQLKKLEELREHMIDYLSKNNTDRRKTERWKEDFNQIDKYRRRLKREGTEGQFSFPGMHSDDAVLDPDELTKMNDIYRRWK